MTQTPELPLRRPRRLPRAAAVAAVAAVLVAASAGGEEAAAPPAPTMPPFDQYDPPSTLVVPEHPLTRAKYPFVDVHSHQPGMPEQDLAPLVAAMDGMNMAVMVNLSGRGFRTVKLADGSEAWDHEGGDYLQRAIAAAQRAAPGRFLVFTNVSFLGIGREGWSEQAVRQLEADVRAGAAGLKVYKNLGLELVDAAGKRVPVDDPRLDPIWQRCGELGIPVLIHSAEPAAFWLPKDGSNERLFEMIEKPGRWRGGGDFPPFEQILAEQHRVFRRHPRTTFIDAHLGWLGNDLGRLGRLLDELPNVYTEIGAVLAELGRQPRAGRDFMIRHQDRILFGKDSWAPGEYATNFRVLETADEYFPYYRRRHAFWRLYGLELPDEVLQKLYFRNALKLFPQIDRARFPG